MQASERTLDSVGRIRRMMNDLIGQIHSDVQVLADPHARALFKAAEESISKSMNAIRDFEQEQGADSRTIYTLHPQHASGSGL